MKHIMELVGKTRVTIVDGQVVSVEEPVLEWCPIFAKYRNIQKITPEEVQKNIELRIREFGLFTPNRKLDGLDDFVSFGASEVMYTGIENNLIDAAVTVCDGAGTVVTSNPELVQGMGARMSGLIYTEPIPETVEAIKKRNGYVIDPDHASIDQTSGFKKAVELGFKRIAVTLSSAEEAVLLRSISKNNPDIKPVLIGVHTTAISNKNARIFAENTDICTLCASSALRKIPALVQVGSAVPLVAYTHTGKELLLERAKRVNTPLLIHGAALPHLPTEKQPYNLC